MEKEIQLQAEEGFHAPMIQALQALRGVAVITATALVAEIGSFRRFKTAKIIYGLRRIIQVKVQVRT